MALNDILDELMRNIRELEKAVGDLEVAATEAVATVDTVTRMDSHPSPSLTVVSDGLVPVADDIVEAELLD
jgi:hypothetical protein